MIKRITILGMSVILFLVTTGCSGWLDLKPESEILLDDYWVTETDVEAVLAACYRGMTEDAIISRMIVWGELRSDNMVQGTSTRYDMQLILEGDILSSNSFCSWSSFYAVINYCNTVLYYAPLVVDRDENFTPDDLKRVEAEALTIRSLCYFYLVRAFGDVPYITDASIDDTQNYKNGKDSANFIIKSILSDLIVARNYARDDFGDIELTKGRITKSAVNALLADIYLWDQQYSNCVTACNNVLSNSNYELVKWDIMYSRVFYIGNSDESIFELQFDDKSIQINTTVFDLYGENGDMYGEINFPATLAHDYLEGLTGAFSPFAYKISSTLTESQEDVRAKDFYRLYGGKYFVFKYAGMARQENINGSSDYRYRTRTANWIVYRLSDVMLMKAEALVQLGGSDTNLQALTLVNTTYLRSNPGKDSLKIESYPSKIDLETLVLRERQRELMFEGKRWFDLVRIARRDGSTSKLNDYVNHKSAGAISLGAPVLNAVYMPISRSELEANPNMKQNPYYEEVNSSSTRD